MARGSNTGVRPGRRCSSIPGFPLWTIPLVLTILVAAGLLVYHKKHKHKNSLVERHPMRQFVFVPLLEHNVP